ncbi:hypothetical protein D9M70_466120 [compost metagenome]
MISDEPNKGRSALTVAAVAERIKRICSKRPPRTLGPALFERDQRLYQALLLDAKIANPYWNAERCRAYALAALNRDQVPD